MDKARRKLFLVLIVVNLVFVVAVVMMLRHSAETAPLVQPLPTQTVTSSTATPITAAPSSTPSPTAAPSPPPSSTTQPRTAFQYQQYSDPTYDFKALYPGDWSLVQATHVSASEIQVKFSGLVNEDPASRSEIFIGHYPGGSYSDWYKTISSLTDNYTLEASDLKNGDLTYSTFFKRVQSAFCRTYVSQVSGGAAILECTYPKTVLSPPEEDLLNRAVLLIAVYLNKAAPTGLP